MSQIIRGARKVNGEMHRQSAVRWPQSHQVNVGFRLVWEATNQLVRGGAPSDDSCTPEGRLAWSNVGRVNAFVGFRLAREDA